MRPKDSIAYGIDGRPSLAVVALDADSVVSAQIDQGAGPSWHFGYTRAEQRQIAEILHEDRGLRSALIMVWDEAVDPDLDGHHPDAYLALHVDGDTGWAEFISGERRGNGRNIPYVTARLGALDKPIRIGRDIYRTRPEIPAEQVRAAGVEYISSGKLPQSVAWQRPTAEVPVGPFGRRIVPEEDLPPKFQWLAADVG